MLVADDSLTTRTMERYILEAAGYEVELAGDGAEALAVLQERGCDVLVSDVEMPGMDGIELTARVRAEPRLRESAGDSGHVARLRGGPRARTASGRRRLHGQDQLRSGPAPADDSGDHVMTQLRQAIRVLVVEESRTDT